MNAVTSEFDPAAIAVPLPDPELAWPSGIPDRTPVRQTLRVLQVVNGEHYAGAERVQDLLALHLPEQNVWSGFVCVKPCRFPQERAAQATPLWELPMRGRWDLRPAYQLARLICRERIDLLHTHNARAALIAALAARWTSVRLIHHVHGQTAVEVGARWWTRCNAWLERRVLGACAGVIAVSASTAAYLQTAGAATERIAVIPNGVPGRANFVKRHPGAVLTLGFIALLRPRKGLEVFLESAALLIQQGIKCRLRIVGRFETPEYERDILARCVALGLSERIDWRGFCQPIDAELDVIDVLAFPSVLPEGMPMVLLEALAAGVPIVACRVPGVTDVIQDGGNGLLVEPNDAADLTNGLQRLLNSRELWQRLSAAGHASHEQYFSAQIMTQRVRNLYDRVLAE